MDQRHSTETPSVAGASIDSVLTRVKQEVGLFYSDGAKAEQNWPQLLSDLKVTPVCGNGHIAFDITSVKMDFNVVNDQTVKGSGGLKIPFGIPSAGGSIGPGLTGSNEGVGTIDLVYTYKPLANGPVTNDFDIIRQNAVILPALDSLRDGLIKATGTRPCFQSLGPKDPDQTLTFSVAVTRDTSETLGFNFAISEPVGIQRKQKHRKEHHYGVISPYSLPRRGSEPAGHSYQNQFQVRNGRHPRPERGCRPPEPLPQAETTNNAVSRLLMIA